MFKRRVRLHFCLRFRCDGQVGKFCIKIGLAHTQKLLQIEMCSVGVEFEAAVSAGRGFLVIGAGVDTFITADEVIGDFAGQVRRYLLFVFYRQIVDAPGSVEETIGL